MKRPLAYLGDAVLRQKARPVEALTPEVLALVEDLIDSMNDIPDTIPVGIAAPQIHVSLRVFVIRLVDEDEKGELILYPPQVYINPVLSDPAAELEECSEGCLSIPGLSAPVWRPSAITVKAMGLDGAMFERRLEGYEARVAMHENDHLNGVLFIDRVSDDEKKRLQEPLRRFKQQHREKTS